MSGWLNAEVVEEFNCRVGACLAIIKRVCKPRRLQDGSSMSNVVAQDGVSATILHSSQLAEGTRSLVRDHLAFVAKASTRI